MLRGSHELSFCGCHHLWIIWISSDHAKGLRPRPWQRTNEETILYCGGTSDAATSPYHCSLCYLMTFYSLKRPYLSFKNNTGWTHGYTYGLTDKPMDRRTDGWNMHRKRWKYWKDITWVGKNYNVIWLVFLDATMHLYRKSCPSVRLSRVMFERRIWPFLKVKSHQMTSQTMIRWVTMK